MRLEDALSGTGTETKTAQPVSRLGDVLSTQSVEVKRPKGEFIFTVPPETKAEWDKRGKIGFFEQAVRQDKTEMVPFNPESSLKAVNVLTAIDRIRKSQDPSSGISPEQLDADGKRVTEFLMRAEEERHRGFSVGGRVAQGAAILPGFAIEFLATDGAAALGRAGVRASIQPVMREIAESGALSFATRTTGALAGATMRTAAMPHRVVESFAERQAKANLELSESGIELARTAHESPFTSSMKAFGDVLIENFSEVTGSFITKVGKSALPKAMVKGLEGVFKRLHPNEAVTKLWTKAGYNGILSEMGEERVGNFIRALTGVEDFGADNPHSVMDRVIASIPSAEELLVEGLVFSVPGAMNMGVGATIDMIKKRKKEGKHKEPVLKDLTPEQLDELAKADKTEEATKVDEKKPTEKTVDNSAEIKKLKDDFIKATSREVAILNESADGVSLSESFKIPANLSKSKPRYGYRGGLYEVAFENDFDRAAYVVAADNKSAKHDQFIEAFKAAGVSEAEAKAHGKAVREAIKKQAAEMFNSGEMEGMISLEAQPGVSEKIVAPRADRTAELGQVRKQQNSLLWRIEKLQKEQGKPVTTTEKKVEKKTEAKKVEPVAETTTENLAEKNRAIKAKAAKGKTLRKMVENIEDAGNQADRLFTPTSSILGRISRKLRDALVKFEGMLHQAILKDKVAVMEFIDATNEKMSDEEITDLTFYLNSQDKKGLNELLAKHDLQKEYQVVAKTLADIATRAKERGLPLRTIADFFPRVVADHKGLLSHMKKTEHWSEISEAIEAWEKQNSKMSDDQKAEFIDQFLNTKPDSKMGLPVPGGLKRRKIEKITPELNEFYKDSRAALLNYVTSMNTAIESNRFFNVKKEQSEDRVENVIGTYVADLIDNKQLTHAQGDILIDALKFRFNPGHMSRSVGLMRDLSYIDTLGGPQTAVRQLGDIGNFLFKFGYYRTAKSFLETISGQAELNKESIGISNIGQEFADDRQSAQWVRNVLGPVLGTLDSFSKAVGINAAFDKLQSEAKKNTPKFNERLSDFFGAEASEVLADLKEGRASDNVKLLLFSEISELQPISPSEMPPQYNKAGNGKVLYMLKSYTIKQVDIYRREAFDKIATPGSRLEGIKNLVNLTFALGLMGAGTEALISLMLGKDFDLSDAVVNNIFKLMGFSTYLVEKAGREGLVKTASAAVGSVIPPLRFIDNLIIDVAGSIADGDSPLDWKSARSVPWGGELFYWWLGGGSDDKMKSRHRPAMEAP